MTVGYVCLSCQDGVSVMEAAVTGKDSGSMEKVPLVFLSPPLHYPPVAGGLCSGNPQIFLPQTITLQSPFKVFSFKSY